VAPFHDRLLEIARTYESFGMCDPRLRLAPVLCAFDVAHPALRMSSSSDAPGHGQKLYALFVKERQRNPGLTAEDYVRRGKPSSVGQVVVKEAWVPREVKKGTPQTAVTRTLPSRERGKTREEAIGVLQLPALREQGRPPLPGREEGGAVRHVQAGPVHAGH
jgi:hypothetical protein